MSDEPELRSDCPLSPWIPKVNAMLMSRQMFNQKVKPTNLRICQELRAMSKELSYLPQCPHYPAMEDLRRYF